MPSNTVKCHNENMKSCTNKPINYEATLPFLHLLARKQKYEHLLKQDNKLQSYR